MLHYTNRNDKIHILTMDHVFLEDIYERLHEYPGMESIELVKPGDERSEIKAEDIRKLARDTVTSRVLIIDVRSQTKPILQRAYSDIVGFNRPDLNRYCYIVLIGEGPINLFQPDRGVKTFHPYLADLRVNFNPAVFFGDPFLYYSYEEIQEGAMYERNSLPERIPQRFEKYFRGDRLPVRSVRKYFRATGEHNGEKLRKKTERQKVLKKLCLKLIKDEFPDSRELFIDALSKKGFAFPGEILKLNVYPFFFEEWVFDLIKKAQSAI